MGLLSLLFPIFLALILIVVLFGIIYLIKKREGEIKDEMKSLRDKLKDIDEDINEFIDLETLEEELEKILEEESFNYPCLIPPYSTGTCDPGFKIETGEDTGKKCCYPEDSIKPSNFETKLKLANQIIQEILIAMVAGELLERMVKKLVGKTSVKAGGKVAVSATARAAKAARAAKRSAQAAKAVAMSIRTAIKASRALAKAIIGGPVGAAFLVADIIGMVLDIKDTAGYKSFIPRDTFTNTKNVIDYEFGKALELEDLEFPMIYPLGQLYAKPYETAMELAYAKLIDKYFVSDMELEKNSEYKKAFDDYVDALIDSIVNETDDEPELPKKIEEYAIKIPEDRYTERDELIYEEMKNLIPLGDLVSNTQMYPKISSPKTIGISLSEQGAKRMNEKNKPKWLNDDMETLAAIYTDKYYIYESGTSDNPVMKEMTLPEKTVLATGYGTLFSMCEKRRKLKSSSAAITPTNYGSYFDFENSKCVFTSSLCNRYGLKLENNDCVMREGQEVAEIIFGTTTVRASIDQWQDRQNQFESGDFGEIASATVQTILDPTGVLAAVAENIPDEVFNPTNADGASYASSWGLF